MKEIILSDQDKWELRASAKSILENVEGVNTASYKDMLKRFLYIKQEIEALEKSLEFTLDLYDYVEVK